MGAVIILILLGIFLFLVELLLIPGITVALVGAVIMTVSGVYTRICQIWKSYWFFSFIVYFSKLTCYIFVLTQAKTGRERC